MVSSGANPQGHARARHDYLLQGIIEIDEAYLGAPKSGKKRGRGTEREKMAVAVSTVDASKYEPRDLKWVHTAIENFKSFLLGTYHGSCGDYQPYLDEFCFRFNRRFFPGQLFARLATAVATSCALLN